MGFLVDFITRLLMITTSFSGHSYNLNDKSEIEKVTATDANLMKALSTQIRSFVASDLPLTISIGSTPSIFGLTNQDVLGIATEDNCIWEIHPGNYTFYDRQQEWTGSCSIDRSIPTFVACRIMARVIGHYPDRNIMIVDAGSTALTKDNAPQGGFAEIDGFPGLECFSVSQEVSRIRSKCSEEELPYGELPLGSIIFLKPNHSCLSAACFEQFYVIENEKDYFNQLDEVVEKWVPVKGWS